MTERDEFGNTDIMGIDSADLQLNLNFDEFNKVTDALNRLAQYEDLKLMPEEIKSLLHDGGISIAMRNHNLSVQVAKMQGAILAAEYAVKCWDQGFGTPQAIPELKQALADLEGMKRSE